MKRRRVVVTGIGSLSSLGQNTQEYWNALSTGQCGIRPMAEKELAPAAQLLDYEPEEHFSKKVVRDLDPFAQYFVLAGREALASSGLTPSPTGTAVISATASAGQVTIDQQFRRLYQENKSGAAPLTIPRAMSSAGASRLCLEFGLRGPALAISTACSSSNHAIGMAYWMVRHGMAEAAITGGSEAPFAHGNLKAWQATRILDSKPCRPFSACRNGISLGEGAACLVLEDKEKAEERGATILGEILGFGMTADAYHLMKPSSEGAVAAMRAALLDADLEPEQIDYVNAHGTGTALNDSTETEAVKEALGAHWEKVLVSSTKSMHGHTLGAAGALEAAATLLALQNGLVPPTINYGRPDPECNLNIVTGTARSAPLKYALSNSFAFGGLNAVLVFGAATDD